LHEKATTNLCGHCVQRARAKFEAEQPAREIPAKLLLDVAREALHHDLGGRRLLGATVLVLPGASNS
jgi:hypothetical protein